MYPSLPTCLCLLLALQPALSRIYSDLATSLGGSYRYLARETDLSVSNSNSSIRTQDFSEIFVWDSSTVFVGAENFILKIDANLDIERTYSVSGVGGSCTPLSDIYLNSCGNYFRVFLNISNSLYTCYTNGSGNPVCVTLDPTDFSTLSSPALFSQMNSVPEGFISPTQPALLYQRNFAIYVVDTSGERRIVTGSVYDDSELNRITVIDPFLVGTGTTPYKTTTFYFFEVPLEVKLFFDAASFARTAHNYVNSSNNFIYFMFYEPSNNLISGLAKSRVGRFCLQGPSDDDSTVNTMNELPQMESFIKGDLQCGTVFPSLVQDWLYVPADSDYHYYAVFSSLAKGPQTSYLCIYSMNAIRDEMDLIKMCDADARLETTNAFEPISGGPSFGHVGGLFTQLQRYTFDFNDISYEIIYVSLSNGSLIKYCLDCPAQFQLVHLMQVVPSHLINTSFPELSAIDRLQLSGDFLLAGGYTGLYRVPLQTCQTLGDSFRECLRDPMCYYNISSNLCEAVTATSVFSNLTLHFSQYTNATLPSVPSCSDLTGTLFVFMGSESTTLNYSWTCVADFVTIVISFSDNRSDVTYLHANTAGSQSASPDYFLLNETLISSFSIRPFFLFNPVYRALPGPVLYSYVTYNVTQTPPQEPSCSPLPPICAPPVCIENPSCSDFCLKLSINCSLLSFACADQILYTLNGGAETAVSGSSLIMVSFLYCANSCLFQSYSHNTTTGNKTAGTSYWLHLISPIGFYTPVLSVSRLPGVYDVFSFSTRFSELSTHSCATPTIDTYPSTSPHTLQTCNDTFIALGSLELPEKSRSSTMRYVEVFSSQQVLPPVSLQLNISNQSDINSCSFNADVTVSWQHPAYAITPGNKEYFVSGSVCGVDSAILVFGAQEHVCKGVQLSHNTPYSVSVRSYEPCYNKTFASSTVTIMIPQAPPSVPQGLSYVFYPNQLMFKWYPPICVNSNDSIQYHVITYRTPCNSSDPPLLYMNTTDGNTTASIQISSTINYMYTINVSAVTGAGESAAVRLAVTTPTRAEFNCQDCRIDKVTIDDLLSVVNWTTTEGCTGLDIYRFNLRLYRGSALVNHTYVPGTLDHLPGGYRIFVLPSGDYAVWVFLYLKDECSVADCVSSWSKAFLFYTSPPSGGGSLGTSDTPCQDEKAYIILGLAVIAIVCAVGNFGFMFVAFCVFCIPRKKVLCC